MNPLMIKKILMGAKVFVIAGIVFYAFTVLKTCEENRVAERDGAIVANAEKVTAQANAADLATANAQLAAIAKAQADALTAAAKARAVTDSQFLEIRKTQAEQKAVLEGNKLNRVVRENPEAVERLANKATRERFDEVESIFDGT